MILQRIRIIMGDAGFEPGTPAPEVCCTEDIFTSLKISNSSWFFAYCKCFLWMYSTYTLLCNAVFKIFNIGQVSEREKLHLPGQCAGEADRHDRAPGGLVPRGPAHCRQKRHARRQSGQKGKRSSSLQYVRICMNIIIIGIVEPPRFWADRFHGSPKTRSQLRLRHSLEGSGSMQFVNW